MLEAKKSKWFETIFAVYNRNLFKRRFHSVNVAGLDHLREIKRQIPLIIYANHSSWWDGLVAFSVFRQANLDAFCMMEEKQLKNLFLFQKLGAFSVIRENPREAIKSINYAADLLRKKNRTLLIFPQGEILPNDVRPINFFTGLSHIIEKTGEVYACPMAIRYEFSGKYKPDIFVRFDLPELIDGKSNFRAKDKTRIFAERLTANLDKLKIEIISNNFDDFKRII